MTPHFRWSDGTIHDAESLANNVLDAFGTAFPLLASVHKEAKVYDVEGTPPVYPQAHVIRPGSPHPLSTPGEIAICLSFSNDQPTKYTRGRIYLPVWLMNAGMAGRPSNAVLTSAVGLGQQLYNVGGANVDWIVWSKTTKKAAGITQWWCDDEWDTQRSRGLRPTTRVTGSARATKPVEPAAAA